MWVWSHYQYLSSIFFNIDIYQCQLNIENFDLSPSTNGNQAPATCFKSSPTILGRS